MGVEIRSQPSRVGAMYFTALLVAVLFLPGCPPMVVGPPAKPPPPAYIPPPSPPEVSYPTVTLYFMGVDADKVGTGFQPTPNGDPDGHFALEIDTGGTTVQVVGLLLYTSDYKGNAVFSTQGGQSWTTTGPGWILGVERDGRRLNPSDRAVRDVVRGMARYDLYADGGKWFGAGQYFTILVRLSDGRTARKIIRID